MHALGFRHLCPSHAPEQHAGAPAPPHDHDMLFVSNMVCVCVGGASHNDHMPVLSTK